MTFITLEGSEGVGKSTALSYIQHYFADKNRECVFTREPGGTLVGEKIRELLLMHQEESILRDTELLLLFAARAQHIAHVIKPALSSGKTVVSDRFTDASFAYQGGGRGVPLLQLETLTQWIQGDVTPDLTLLLDAPVEVGLSRIHKRAYQDRIESEKIDFFQRVRDAYLVRAKQYPERFVVINAAQSIDQVQMQMRHALDQVFCE